MATYIFPGQGSQQKGMGKELFDEFRSMTDKADEILGYSIKDLCLNDPSGNLANTQYTQPALYVVNALTYLKLLKDTDNKKPSYVAGHSLGEYNALFAAEVFDFETGLRLVKKRGELMGQAFGGGMAAVIGFSEEKIKETLNNYDLTAIDVANYNTPSQFVISSTKDEIDRAKAIFEKEGARMYIKLNVSGAFHSRYMENARMDFQKFVDGFDFSEPKIPIISNYTARPYKSNEIRTNLINQITNSVKWTDGIVYLMHQGETEFVQVGPGNVLKGLVAAIQREAGTVTAR